MLAQRLYGLDRSSTRFPEQLNDLLHDEEWAGQLKLLPEGELTKLIGCLDDVRSIPTSAGSHLSPPQTLDGLDGMGSSFRRCLLLLRKICSSRTVLPATYEVSSALSFNAMEVVARGGFCDVYKETLLIGDVCIKRLRISTTGDQAKVKQVSCPPNLRPGHHALTSFGGALQGGRGVEAPRSPKHCALQGCHLRTPSTRLRMDARWGVERVHQE